MQSITYHLDVSELDNRLIDSIKSMFKNGRLNVTVTTEEKEITSSKLLKTIEANQKADHHYAVPAEEFADLANQVSEDENFDAVSVIKKYKVNR